MKYALIFILFFSPSSIFAQYENSVNDPVYDYLRYLSLTLNITNYDDIILPLSDDQILFYLNSVDTSKLNILDGELLLKFKEKYKITEDTSYFFNNFENFFSYKKHNFFSYNKKTKTYTVRSVF